MNEKQLTISELRTVMGWSYPTALKFAKNHGVQLEDGKWYINKSAIENEVNKLHGRANTASQQLVIVTNSP